MVQEEPDTDQLLVRVAEGDAAARDRLLARHRARLRKMVALRLDRRLWARVDPSDVVQEALTDAAQKLPKYVQERPLPFYPWLRQLAWERLIQLHRWHIRTAKRTVTREDQDIPALPDDSALVLADSLVARSSSPSSGLRRSERRKLAQKLLAQLSPPEREVLVLRYLEHLSTREIGAVLGLTEAGVKSRHLRALRQLRDLLGDEVGE